jgi:hypothetical protein
MVQIAVWVVRPGRNAEDFDENLDSKTGSRNSNSTSCTILSGPTGTTYNKVIYGGSVY